MDLDNFYSTYMNAGPPSMLGLVSENQDQEKDKVGHVNESIPAKEQDNVESFWHVQPTLRTKLRQGKSPSLKELFDKAVEERRALEASVEAYQARPLKATQNRIIRVARTIQELYGRSRDFLTSYMEDRLSMRPEMQIKENRIALLVGHGKLSMTCKLFSALGTTGNSDIDTELAVVNLIFDRQFPSLDTVLTTLR